MFVLRAEIVTIFEPKMVTISARNIPWIPEPSTVNNKLKRREGSGIQGTRNTNILKICKLRKAIFSVF
jgi:hypothetical protein